MSNSRPSPEEKTWMKENYGGEFKFLRSHGLNIYKDDHREEGRAIAQAFMKQDEANAADDGCSSGGKYSGTATSPVVDFGGDDRDEVAEGDDPLDELGYKDMYVDEAEDEREDERVEHEEYEYESNVHEGNEDPSNAYESGAYEGDVYEGEAYESDAYEGGAYEESAYEEDGEAGYGEDEFFGMED